MASAAYRAGEKLHSEYYGEISDYTRKGGVICSEILLPSHAPPEYADRETLWNAVEKAERGKKAQLAYSFDMALQNEISLEENIALAREFVQKYFVYPLYKIPTTCLYCFKTILQFFFSSFTHFCKEISSASDLVSRMIAEIPLSSGRYQPSGLSITPLNPN